MKLPKFKWSIWWILLALCVVYNGYFMYVEFRRPSLANGLPSLITEKDFLFNKRVQEKFPTGMDESVLVHELEKQGFEVRKQERAAVYKEYSLVCNVGWVILWSLDEKSKLKEVKGDFQATCL